MKKEFSNPSSSLSKQILLVDRQVQLTDVIGLFLRKHGFRTIAYNDPQSAFKCLQEKHNEIHLIIADFSTNIHGENNHNNLNVTNIPIIVTSASSCMDNDIVSQHSVLHLLYKPFSATQLLSHIECIFGKNDREAKNIPLMARKTAYSTRRSAR